MRDLTNLVAELPADAEPAFHAALATLAEAAAAHDTETGNHILRVNEYSHALADLAGQDPDFCRQIRFSAQLHDLGKLGIHSAVLQKAGPLDALERAAMDNHPQLGHEILQASPRLAMAAEIALAHHEKWDGTGYPNNLRGDDIPLSARIVAIADVYDALRATRPYKAALGHDAVVSIMLDGDGRIEPAAHFDPDLLALFGAHHRTFDHIWTSMHD